MCAVLIGAPTVLLVVQQSEAYLHGPVLAEGDLLETRSCRMCDGSGKDPEMAEQMPHLGDRCSFCRGQGKVQVIVPGPNRPVRVWGGVVDADLEPEPAPFADGPSLRFRPNPFAPGGVDPLPGGIWEAKVVLVPESGPEIVFQAGKSGRFSREIPPGIYTVRVSARGFDTEEHEIEIKPMTEPIWLEKAQLIEPEDDSGGSSRYGVELKVILARPESDASGSIRLRNSGPFMNPSPGGAASSAAIDAANDEASEPWPSGDE